MAIKENLGKLSVHCIVFFGRCTKKWKLLSLYKCVINECIIYNDKTDAIALPDFGIEYSIGIEIRKNAHKNDQEKQIRSQNEEYYKIYDYLRKFVSIEDQRNILYANSQKVHDSLNLEQVSDLFLHITRKLRGENWK